jgi:hypothetical protein
MGRAEKSSLSSSPTKSAPKIAQTRNEADSPSVSVNWTGSARRRLVTAPNRMPPANAAMKPFPPIATDPPYASNTRARIAICSDTAEVQPRWLANAGSLPPRYPTTTAATIASPICLIASSPPSRIAERFLGRDRGDEEGDEWRRDAVVEAALDVERSSDAHRNGLVGDDRQAERRVGGRQDGGDQGCRRPPDLGKHEVGEQRAGNDRERQPDEQQPARQTCIALDIPQLDRRGIGEQQQGEGQLGDGQDRLVAQREGQDIQPTGTQDRSGGDEHHRAGDPPMVELRRHQCVGDHDDRQSGETPHHNPLAGCACAGAVPGPSAATLRPRRVQRITRTA